MQLHKLFGFTSYCNYNTTGERHHVALSQSVIPHVLLTSRMLLQQLSLPALHKCWCSQVIENLTALTLYTGLVKWDPYLGVTLQKRWSPWAFWERENELHLTGIFSKIGQKLSLELKQLISHVFNVILYLKKHVFSSPIK